MREILVSGYYGFSNAGDEAILGGMIAAVHRLDPTVRFTVISGDPERTRAAHGVNSICRSDLGGMWQALSRCDLLISGGGSLLQDVTGFKSIPYYLGIALIGKLRRLPVMFYAQGVGPVRGSLGKKMIPFVGNRMDYITVRDRRSLQILRHMGVTRPHVEVTADAALALGPADPAEGRRLLAGAGVPLDGRPVLGVSVRPWSYTGGQMEPALASALDQLIHEAGVHVVFLPMQWRPDVAASAAIRRMMSRPATIMDGEYTYRQIQSLVGSCDLIIGMRYHALVFAAMAGVPVVGLSYDPKNDGFLELLGQRAVGTVRSLEVQALQNAVNQSLIQAPVIRNQYREIMGRLTAMSHRNAEIALQLIEQRRES